MYTPLNSLQICEIARFDDHNDSVFDFVIGHLEKEKKVISCSSDKTIRIFSKYRCEKTVYHTSCLYSVIHLPESDQLMTTDHDGDLVIWDLFPELKISKKTKICESDSTLWKLTRVAFDTFVCCVMKGICKGNIYKLQRDGNGKNEFKVKELKYPLLNDNNKERQMCICQLETMKNLFLCGGGDLPSENGVDFRIKIIDWEKEELWKSLSHELMSETINCLESIYGNDGKERILSGGNEKILRIWNLEGTLLKELRSDEKISSLLRSSKSEFLMIGAYFGIYSTKFLGNILFLDLDQFKSVVSLANVHADSVRLLKFWNEEETEFVTSSWDGQISIQKICFDRYYYPVQKFEYIDLEDFEKIQLYSDICFIPEYDILVALCDDFVFYDLNQEIVISLASHELKTPCTIFYWNEQIAVIDLNFLYIYTLQVQIGEKVKKVVMEKKGKFKLGVKGNYFSNLLFLESSNILLSSCFFGEYNRGELKEIAFGEHSLSHSSQSQSQSQVVTVNTVFKMKESINEICFSKINPSKLYFGGGNYNGSDFTLKVYDFKDHIFLGELLRNISKARIFSIACTRGNKGVEFLCVGSSNSEILILRDEEYIRKLNSFGQGCISLVNLFDCNCLLAGGGNTGTTGDIFMVDLNNMKVRKLTKTGEIGDRVNKMSVYRCKKGRLKDEFLVFAMSSGDSEKTAVFSVLENMKLKAFNEDVIERIEYLRFFLDNDTIKNIKIIFIKNSRKEFKLNGGHNKKRIFTLMNREKLGSANIDWKSAVFGFKKYRRKTIGWGRYDRKEREYEDEIYIREVSIIEGGIGCALWDASIILTRFFHTQLDLFRNRTILELGAGCGLPSLCIARTASKVYLTDYMDSLLENLKYNVFINSNFEEEELDPKFHKNSKNNYELACRKKKIHDTCIVKYLDWYDIDKNIGKMNSSLDNCKFEFIFGSELTYTLSENTVDCLIKTICEFLTEDGIFMEILSTDRDGVSYFLKSVEGIFDVFVFSVSEEFQKNLKIITTQRAESYKFYLLKRTGQKRSKIFDTFYEKLKEQEPKIE